MLGGKCLVGIDPDKGEQPRWEEGVTGELSGMAMTQVDSEGGVARPKGWSRGGVELRESGQVKSQDSGVFWFLLSLLGPCF